MEQGVLSGELSCGCPWDKWMGWGSCSCNVITGEVGMDSQSYGWSSLAVLSCIPASSGEGVLCCFEPIKNTQALHH